MGPIVVRVGPMRAHAGNCAYAPWAHELRTPRGLGRPGAESAQPRAARPKPQGGACGKIRGVFEMGATGTGPTVRRPRSVHPATQAGGGLSSGGHPGGRRCPPRPFLPAGGPGSGPGPRPELTLGALFAQPLTALASSTRRLAFEGCAGTPPTLRGEAGKPNCEAQIPPAAQKPRARSRKWPPGWLAMWHRLRPQGRRWLFAAPWFCQPGWKSMPPSAPEEFVFEAALPPPGVSETPHRTRLGRGGSASVGIGLLAIMCSRRRIASSVWATILGSVVIVLCGSRFDGPAVRGAPAVSSRGPLCCGSLSGHTY